MRAWKIGVLGAIAVAVPVAIAAWEVRKLGKAVGHAMEGAFEGSMPVRFRILAGDTPDLDVAPGTPGYHDSLHTVGPQRHYHAKGTDTTTIATQIRIDDKSLWMPVAEYDGAPSREVAAGRLRRVPLPWSVVHVRVVDAEGRPRGRVGVCWTVPGNENHGTSFGDAGEVDLVLCQGTWMLGIDGEGPPHHELTLPTGDAIRCTLGPNGLVVER